MQHLISLREASNLIESTARTYGTEEISLKESLGRILAEDVYADRDYPPFNRAAMDGFAIRMEDLNLVDTFVLTEEIFAGQFSDKVIGKGTCVRIMTGAPVPEGADMVVRKEDSEQIGDLIRLKVSAPRKGMNIAAQGQDKQKGEIVVEKGALIQTGVYSTLAVLGHASVLVHRKPSITLITTGNELKKVGEEVKWFEIRDSNSYSVEGFLRKYDLTLTNRLHAQDDLSAMSVILKKGLQTDILIITGGVSMGEADHVPKALEAAEVTGVFHKVQIRPGKPFWFGNGPGGQAVFALPGNPLSVQVGFRLFVEPYLRLCFGMKPNSPLILPLGKDRNKKANLDEFFPCNLVTDKITEILPSSFNGSGDITAMAQSDGFAKHPLEKENLKTGDFVEFYPW